MSTQQPVSMMPQPPAPLTMGMPDPTTITKQKDAYMKMLDEQAKQGTAVFEAQTKHQKDYLVSQAEQQKKQFVMQIEMEVRQQEMALDQQKQEQLMALQQQAAQQKAALEQQAMQLAMEYQQKKAEEDMQKQQYEMEKKQYEMQMNMQKEMEKFQGQGMDVFGGGMQGGPLPFTGLTGTFSTMPMVAPTVGVPNGGQVYEYGPNGELVPKATQ